MNVKHLTEAKSMSNKNTVKADNQLKINNSVTFEGDGKLKIMFVGNSITRHGVLEEIGWNWDFGMAASCKEKDYVHILIDKINKKTSAQYCICQAAKWEQNHKNPEEYLPVYTPAREFGADIIVMRIVENCHNGFDAEAFEKNYPELINYLNTNNAKLVLSSGFWAHEQADSIIENIAEKLGAPYVYLGDLGADAKMRADGKFWHEGVQHHPGDLGMENIANRLYAEIEKLI